MLANLRSLPTLYRKTESEFEMESRYVQEREEPPLAPFSSQTFEIYQNISMGTNYTQLSAQVRRDFG
jgi:hypothetical protein